MKSILTRILLCLLFLQTANASYIYFEIHESAEQRKERWKKEEQQIIAARHQHFIDTIKNVAGIVLSFLALSGFGKSYSYVYRHDRRYSGYIDGVQEGSQPCINMKNFAILNAKDYARSFADLADNGVSTFDNLKAHHFNEGLHAGIWHGRVACRSFRRKRHLKKAWPMLSKILKRPLPRPKKCFDKHRANGQRKK